MTGNVVKGKLYDVEPDYADPEGHDFAQRPGSRLAQLGIGVKK